MRTRSSSSDPLRPTPEEVADLRSRTGRAEIIARQLQAQNALDLPAQIGAAGQPAFKNSWTNFDAAGAGARAARFYTHQGRVYLAGVVKGGASGTIAFTLPTGYRPLVSDITQAMACSGGVAHVRITSIGDVSITAVGTGSTPSTFCFLDGISFRAA
jgi:hypothetical protein